MLDAFSITLSQAAPCDISRLSTGPDRVSVPFWPDELSRAREHNNNEKYGVQDSECSTLS
jgi:hypothetical protein